jgi:hypothetical protein
MTRCLVLALLISASFSASAEVLFEAFFRIEKAGKHTGYLVQRLSQSNGTKTLISYIHTVDNGIPTFETFKSVANAQTLVPVESAHGGNTMGMRRTLSAFFKDGKAWVDTLLSGSRKPANRETIDKRYAPMQGSFLFYAADLPQLKKGKNYEFNFYAERTGKPSYGQLNLENTKNGIQHVVLDILGEPTENFLTPAGDPVGARAPADGTIVFWVKTKKEAVGLLEYPSNAMISMFGDLPEGKKNPWYSVAGYDARAVVLSFPKSFGTRALASKERRRITAKLPMRTKGKAL